MCQRLPQPAEQVPDDEANMLVTRGTLGLYAGRTTSAISDHVAVLRTARRTSIYQIARCHFQMATLLVNSGDRNQALVHARTAASIASDEQQIWIGSQCQAVLATVLAYRGDSELAGRHLAGAESLAASRARRLHAWRVRTHWKGMPTPDGSFHRIRKRQSQLSKPIVSRHPDSSLLV
jgi:hypothetical protein